MGASTSKTAVLLDPYPLWLDAVEPVLQTIGVDVVGRATNPEQALALVEEHTPDLVVAETATLNGGMSGTSFIRTARQRVSSLRVIVLGGSSDPADIDAAFDAGAVAYVIKTAQPADVAATIRQVFDHSVFLARIPTVSDAGVSEIPSAEGADELAALTRRELEILQLVAQGHSNRELAKILWVTEQTVKFHLSNIYRKLDVSNRTEASHWAHKHRLVATAEAALA